MWRHKYDFDLLIDWLLIQHDFQSLMIECILLEINIVVMLWRKQDLSHTFLVVNPRTRPAIVGARNNRSKAAG